MKLPAVRYALLAARHWVSSVGVILVLLLGMSGLLSQSVLAAGTLTNLSWAVSNNAAGATAVNYSYSFTTATTGTIATIVCTVSGGTLAGTPTVVTNYGIGAGTVGAITSGTTITYTVTSPVSVASGIPIFLEFGGLTNMAASTYTTSIETEASGSVAIDGPTNTPSITFSSTNTAKTIVVAQSLTFTLGTTSFQLNMDPSLPALADQSFASTLTVQTNANSGYTLTAADSTGLKCTGCASTPSIPAVATSNTFVSWPGAPANATGYTVTGTATITAGFSGTKYTGYSSGTPLQIASYTSGTGATAQTITVTDQTAIDFADSAGTYTDTITYTVTPNYS